MGLSRRRKILVTLATLIGTFLAALDSTVVGTAMPTVIGDLGGLGLYPWVFASYLLAATVTGPLFGRLSDAYGRKPVYLAGVSLFLLGSVLCGTAGSMGALIVYRTIQGLGAGAVQPVAVTIVGDIFELETRARIQGLFGAVWGVSAVVGPAAGGLITDYLSWRWVFYVNVPFGLAAGALLALALRESFERRPGRADYPGVFLLTGGLLAVLLAVLGAGSLLADLALLAGGASALALFVLAEARAPDPIVPLELFRERLFAVASAGNAALGGVLLGVSVYVPLYVQGALGGTALTAGTVVAPLSIGWPVGSFVGGRMLLRAGYRTTLLVGSAFVVAGSAMCLALDAATPLAYVILSVFVIGLGMGFSSTSYLVSVQNAVPWHRRGIATSSVVFFRTIGGSLGVAVMGALLDLSLGERYRAAVERAAGENGALARLLSDPNALLQPALRAKIPEGAYGELASALASALSPAFWAVAVMAVAALAVSALFPAGRAEDFVKREPRP
ncbi:Drug resistance transporter EmrB/QacA subfamily [Rubrobacter xylanophilus DSM 9941]|uniref:Drug resistance transporter EmrB/QacA subfamily n=1 Tax=Rubrobacter xylanophilus (strain DSM 9941 / JCM 11954 / NBRC 16129 / PRD-1) TaxID=266117 RepID=Q1ATX5_RUBXD|nr:MDR family MFS transporter [Rubrobacter xylanophilus]ABG05153.1 Drug resistance transporter EmrB/QacA subfamily [Rubrobacter xylanophilus DSM 9941]